MERLALYGGPPIRKERLPIFQLSLTDEEIARVVEVLRSGQISRGPLRDRFAERFCAYTGARHAVAVASGTAALHLALKALDLPPGSEVIVPSLTFVATAFAAEYCGLRPVFAEIDPETLNLSPEDVARKITPRTRAIIPVHFAGQVADMEALYEIALSHNLAIIEDAAHAIGATYEGQKIGATPTYVEGRIPHLVCFSLFATKNMTAAEGGIITTYDESLARRIERLRAHGIVPLPDAPRTSGYYDVVELGYNYHMSNLHIALGMAQLDRLDDMNYRRKYLAQRLTSLLSDIPGIRVPNSKNDHVYHLYTILLDSSLVYLRDTIIMALLAEGIQVGLYYRPVHMFSYFMDKYGYSPYSLPVTELVSDSIITLPIYPLLSDNDLRDIHLALKKVIYHFFEKGGQINDEST